MSSKDTLIHELSTSGTSAEPAVFLKKSQLTILDQNTSYHGSQSRINTSAISNSTYLDINNPKLVKEVKKSKELKKAKVFQDGSICGVILPSRIRNPYLGTDL
jgi:hypothetical protein